MQTTFKAKAELGVGYDQYKLMVDNLLSSNKTTGENHSEAYINYTKLNVQRAHRIEKTIDINNALKSKISSISTKQTWLVLVEAWCGDVPQNLPIISKLAELSDKIELKILLRDEHLDLMEHYKTDGGIAIPKLIAFKENYEELFNWGPRPAAAQQIIRDWKADGKKEAFADVAKSLQLWYAKDKGQSIQNEFAHLI